MNLSINALHSAYRAGTLTPRNLLSALRLRIEANRDHHIWIHQVDDDYLADILDRLVGNSPDCLPLYGVPFAIKDNIDLAGIDTTAGCPAFAYTPTQSATVVQRLIDAGAIPLGKTNLDQFATGLVGTRSPYGATRNAFDPAYISGGSSSGSAVAVALGEVSFSLGTDTAGSGRVPAAFNSLVGIKPTRGRWSTHGIVPACRTLDCPSLFALNPEDAAKVMAVLDHQDPLDPWARPMKHRSGRVAQPRVAVPLASQRYFSSKLPDPLALPGNPPGNDYPMLYERSIDAFARQGAQIVEVDISSLLDAARLLYQGPWIAERYHATRSIIESTAGEMLEVTRSIIAAGAVPTAIETFDAFYRLQQLRARANELFADIDLMLLPTAPGHPSLDEEMAEPLAVNSELGHYTNFVNLLDMAAVTMPAGMTAMGLPFGLTLVAPAFSDDYLLNMAWRAMAASPQPQGAVHGPWLAPPPPAIRDRVSVAVCGAHLSGMPLNHQLTERDGYLLEVVRSAACYRFYALAGGPPKRPGMVRVEDDGAAIEMELWSLPLEQLGGFVTGIPAPLGIGKVELADGRWVTGFICESVGIKDGEDITAYGGWRAFIAR